jgi:hypothetical protein
LAGSPLPKPYQVRATTLRRSFRRSCSHRRGHPARGAPPAGPRRRAPGRNAWASALGGCPRPCPRATKLQDDRSCEATRRVQIFCTSTRPCVACMQKAGRVAPRFTKYAFSYGSLVLGGSNPRRQAPKRLNHSSARGGLAMGSPAGKSRALSSNGTLRPSTLRATSTRPTPPSHPRASVDRALATAI